MQYNGTEVIQLTNASALCFGHKNVGQWDRCGKLIDTSNHQF